MRDVLCRDLSLDGFLAGKVDGRLIVGVALGVELRRRHLVQLCQFGRERRGLDAELPCLLRVRLEERRPYADGARRAGDGDQSGNILLSLPRGRSEKVQRAGERAYDHDVLGEIAQATRLLCEIAECVGGLSDLVGEVSKRSAPLAREILKTALRLLRVGGEPEDQPLRAVSHWSRLHGCL